MKRLVDAGRLRLEDELEVKNEQRVVVQTRRMSRAAFVAMTVR